MNFIYPQFLFALFAVLIPVIIHLFNFQRYKKVYFSNVAFLKEVKHSTKAKSNLKHLLILLSRILAITAIVLAFAQPFLPVAHQNQGSTTRGSSVYIDNSFSTENRSTDGRIFDISREFGYQLIDELPSHINHQLLSNAFSGAEQHLYPTTELIKKTQQLEVIGEFQYFSDIVKRQTSAFDQKSFNSFIISDFQKSQFDFNNISSDSNNQYTLIPIYPVETKNIAIDSIWFKNPIHRINQPEEIHFRIRNHSKKTVKEVRASLLINGEQKAFGSFTIPEQSYIDTFMVFNSKTTGWKKGELKIEDSPIVFDNSFYFNFQILEEIKVLTITSTKSTGHIKKAFQTEPYFNYSEMNESSIDFSALAQTNILFLNEITQFSSGMISSIQKFVENGGSLVIFPTNNPDQNNLNNLLSQLQVGRLKSLNKDSVRVNYLNLESDLYDGVFTSSKSKLNLPQIYSHFNVSSSNSIEQDLLKTVNNHAILSKWDISKGQIYLFTVSLQPESSNLRLHSIFLPTLFQMAFNSTSQTNLYLTIGTDAFTTIKRDDRKKGELFHISNQQLKVDLIPEIFPENNGVKLGFHKSILTAGNYDLTVSDSTIGNLSFNYSRNESDPNCYSVTDLENIIDSLQLTNYSIMEGSIDDFSTTFKKRETGIELWRWFVILALFFLALEIILIRYFKPSVL